MGFEGIRGKGGKICQFGVIWGKNFIRRAGYLHIGQRVDFRTVWSVKALRPFLGFFSAAFYYVGHVVSPYHMHYAADSPSRVRFARSVNSASHSRIGLLYETRSSVDCLPPGRDLGEKETTQLYGQQAAPQGQGSGKVCAVSASRPSIDIRFRRTAFRGLRSVSMVPRCGCSLRAWYGLKIALPREESNIL